MNLAGTLIVYNGIKSDYCFVEAVNSLKDACDLVIIVDCGSSDGTQSILATLIDSKTKIINFSTEEWFRQQGREKLAYFTNKAIKEAKREGFEWQFNLQADEVIHEDSIPFIRAAIEKNNEGYWVRRINLWGNSQYQLNVPIERMPVSPQIIRLCKTNYLSIDDAESINCPASIDFFNEIRIYHMGFVRDKFKHIEKIKHIQKDIFLMDYDKRVDSMPQGFEPLSMGFSRQDLIPIEEKLPKYIREWAAVRDDTNGFVM